MKPDKLKIGTKETPSVAVPFNEPETIEDLQQLSRGDEKVLVRWAARGCRIEHQERSGARDFMRDNYQGFLKEHGSEEAAKAAIVAPLAEIVSGYDPTVVKERVGRPKKPVQVKMTGDTISREDFIAQLKAAGVNVQIVE